MPRTKQTPLEKKTKLLYASMRRRIEERKDKNGRIIRHGRPIPFTYEQLLEWMVNTFGEFLQVKCRYCYQYIAMVDARIDHAIPLKLGGSPGLENLNAICDADNAYKGGLTPEQFELLRRIVVERFDIYAQGDIIGRLKKATKLAASVNWSRKKKARVEQRL